MNGALNPQQVAERLGISRDTVLRLVRSGRLAAVKLGWRTWRITEDALQAFMAGQQPNAPNKPQNAAAPEKLRRKPRKGH